MRHRIPLPESLGGSFTVQDAQEIGIRRGRISSRDLARPFDAVRARRTPTTPMERVLSLAPRLRSEQRVGGSTALQVWRYPHPNLWLIEDDIEIVVPTDAARPRLVGVKSTRLARSRIRGWMLDGIPIVDPIGALFMCAKDLTEDQIVVLLDSMITTSENYPDIRENRPIFTPAEIAVRLREWGRFPSCGQVRDALARIRHHVESPKETETRLLLIASGLPEPAVQHSVYERGRFVARVDLAYPGLKIAIEYEGDGHRRSKSQWRHDIQRQRDLEDLGWIVIRVTELDLRHGGAPLLRRIRNAIATR
ncbi:endonuclease domain-containing protein [Microbacterium sp. ZW T6_19]|uniref:endonuclease domain-containing protein n=1 Tax=Microbacterium sp. ZW T6_19 TaxID=3378082 RepID=UPI0038548AB7